MSDTLNKIENTLKQKKDIKMNKMMLTLIIISAIFVGIILQVSTTVISYDDKNLDPIYKISLQEVELFYSPESKRILLLDRNVETVKQILSEDLTTAIFSIKAFEVNTDFNSEVSQTPAEIVAKSKKSKK